MVTFEACAIKSLVFWKLKNLVKEVDECHQALKTQQVYQTIKTLTGKQTLDEEFLDGPICLPLPNHIIVQCESIKLYTFKMSCYILMFQHIQDILTCFFFDGSSCVFW